MAARDGAGGMRARMDRSLDEIAAEMSPPRESYVRGYGEEEEEGGVGPHRMHHRSYRYSPYSTGHGYSWRGEPRRGGEEGGSSRRLFVANLSYAVTWQRLKDFMRQAGHVEKCDIFKSYDGSSRGMGLVVFADVSAAKRALQELHGAELDGRRLYLREDLNQEEREGQGMSYATTTPRAKPLPNPSATVFVANLDYDVTWQKLKDIFKVAGPVVHVEIQSDKDGRSKGCAVVQFESQTDALNSIALFHGQMLLDRPMTVRMDSKSDYRPDPLQVKLSQRAREAGFSQGRSATGGANLASQLPLLAALGLSSLTSEQVAVLSNPALLRQVLPTARKAVDDREVSRGGGDYPGGRRSPPPPSPPLLRDREREFRGSSLGLRWGSQSSQLRAPLPLPPRSYSPPPPPPPPRTSSYHSDGSYGYGSQEPQRYDNHLPSSDARGRKLFVKNLHYNTTWQRLKDVFRRAGSVVHVDILSGVDGRSRGCAVVSFDHADDARRAIAMFNNYDLDGRRLEVRYDRMS